MLVGSSNNKRSGSQKRARERAILIRQPPENSLVGRFCAVAENPNPAKIAEALNVQKKKLF